MSHDLTVRSRRVILAEGERAATIRVRDGRIVAIDDFTRAGGDSDVDLGDLVVLPGLVDTHVHVNEPGRTEWEGFNTATAAGAAGGVTTIVDMPLNSIPPTTTVAALEVKRRSARGQCHIDVGFWGGLVPDNADELPALVEAGVFGFKCFLADSGVVEFPPVTAAQLAAAVRAVDALFVVHAEAPAELREAEQSRLYQRFLASRPPSAEATAVGWVLDALEGAPPRSRAHILHLSDGDSTLRMLAHARERGVPITAETCPHYLTLVADEVPDGATQFKCCPPIRDEANRDLLWQGLAAGQIDCVVTDHSPCVPQLKRLAEGDFAAAWGGIASLQLGLPVTWTEAAHRGFSLADVVRWMARRPAELVGLTRKGRIAVGADADLVAFDPDETFVVRADELRHRHPTTPYAGRRLRGVVKHTWLRGRLVDGLTPHGQLLTREST